MLGALKALKEAIAARLLDFMSNVVLFQACHGIEIGPDPYWLSWYRGRRRRRRSSFWSPMLDPKEFHNSLPPEWDAHCAQMGYPVGASPIVIRLLLDGRRMEGAKKDGPGPSHFDEHPIVYEPRGRCVGMNGSIQLPSALRITGLHRQGFGTAGGLLFDRASGGRYVVSCAHVLGNQNDGMALTSDPGRRVGTVLLSVLPPPHPPNEGCNRRSSAPSESLDLALAALDPAVDVPPRRLAPQIDFITPSASIRSGDHLAMAGARTGRSTLAVADETLFREIYIDGTPRCFGDVFSLTPPGRWYLNSEITRPGDSGAWLLRNQDGAIGWDGMIFAGDGARAYACYADTIFERCRAAISPALAILP